MRNVGLGVEVLEELGLGGPGDVLGLEDPYWLSVVSPHVASNQYHGGNETGRTHLGVGGAAHRRGVQS